MKTHTQFHKSTRTFQLWEYQVSHGQLLIRSPKAPATSRAPEMLTNLDIVFMGVDYVAVPRLLQGLELVEPLPAEVESVRSILGNTIEPEALKIIASGGKRFSIVASCFKVIENDWDIFDSPFEFRSQFRRT